MNTVIQVLRKRKLIIATLALLVSAAVGVLIVKISPWEGSMTPQQAKAQITTFVDDALAYAAPDFAPVPGPADGNTGACLTWYGGTADANDLLYVREITDFDPALGDEIMERAEQYWREQGLDITRSEGVSGVTRIQSSANGFGYRLVVNRNEPLVSMTAQTPCFSWSEWEEAGIA